MEEEPEWLKTLKLCTWEGERLTGLPETLPPTVKDYLTLIGPGDWESTLDQFVQQVDNCIYLDTGVSFSSNWSDASDEEEELSEVDDGSYSRKMVFCAGPVKRDEVQSDHFLQFLRKVLEQRVKEGLPPVAGQADFCQFVLSKEGTKEQPVKQEDDNSAADTRGQKATTSKTSMFYDPTPHQTGDIGKATRQKTRLSDKHVRDTEGRTMNTDDPIKLTSTWLVGNRRQIYITPAAEKIISELPPRSVDVVSVVGPVRKGKSHLANLLCKRKSGFPLGDENQNQKTKDFWFWIGPHPVQSDRYLMVIDTEGLGDYNDYKDKDMKHLVLATLISNHLVFNLQGNLDSGFVNNLRLMGDLADCIRVQKDGSDEGKSLDKHFPELWVPVQDARQKTPQKHGRRLTPDEFLEMLLEHKDGHTKAIRSHNDMTSTVKAFFPKRHLRLIPAPSLKMDVLSNLDRAVDSDLQTDYKDAVDSFTREIWTSGQVKVNGHDITTTGLLHVMQYYVNAINGPNAMPSILGSYEAMAEGECRRASEEQMKTFQEIVKETVKPLMPTDEATCNRKIKAAVETAVTKLSAAVGHWDKDGAWKRGLQEKLERQRRALLEDNDTKSKDLCDRIIKKADEAVQQKEEDGVYNKVGGFDAYVADMNAVYKYYDQNASGKGPAVGKVLETFRAKEAKRRNTIRNFVRTLEEKDRQEKKAERKKREAEEDAARARRQARHEVEGGKLHESAAKVVDTAGQEVDTAGQEVDTAGQEVDTAGKVVVGVAGVLLYAAAQGLSAVVEAANQGNR